MVKLWLGHCHEICTGTGYSSLHWRIYWTQDVNCTYIKRSDNALESLDVQYVQYTQFLNFYLLKNNCIISFSFFLLKSSLVTFISIKFFKGTSSGLRQNLAIENPLKMIKNYIFTLNFFFVLTKMWISNFLATQTG